MIHRSGSKKERFYKHGNTTQDRWHSVNAFSSIAERMFKGNTMCNQRIYVGGVSSIIAIFQCLVECAYVFSSKALYDEYHHILLYHGVWRKVCKVFRVLNVLRDFMNGGVDGLHLLWITIVFRHHKYILPNRAI